MIRFTLVFPSGASQVVESTMVPRMGEHVEVQGGATMPVRVVRHLLVPTWEEAEQNRESGEGIRVILGTPFIPVKPTYEE